MAFKGIGPMAGYKRIRPQRITRDPEEQREEERRRKLLTDPIKFSHEDPKVLEKLKLQDSSFGKPDKRNKAPLREPKENDISKSILKYYGLDKKADKIVKEAEKNRPRIEERKKKEAAEKKAFEEMPWYRRMVDESKPVGKVADLIIGGLSDTASNVRKTIDIQTGVKAYGEALEQHTDQIDKIRKKMLSEKDAEKKKKLQQILSQRVAETPQVSDYAPDMDKTQLQIIGDGVMGALDAVTLGVGGSILKSGTKGLSKLGAKQAVKQTLKNVFTKQGAKQVGIEAAIGGAYGGTEAIRSGSTDPAEIFKGTAVGSVAGPLIAGGLELGGAAAGKAIRNLRPPTTQNIPVSGSSVASRVPVQNETPVPRMQSQLPQQLESARPGAPQRASLPGADIPGAAPEAQVVDSLRKREEIVDKFYNRIGVENPNPPVAQVDDIVSRETLEEVPTQGDMVDRAGQTVVEAPAKPVNVAKKGGVPTKAEESLIKEAKKYKSAEEFVEAVKADIQSEIPENLEVKNVTIVGSTARGKTNPNDLDLAIDIRNRDTGKRVSSSMGLETPSGLARDAHNVLLSIEKKLGKKAGKDVEVFFGEVRTNEPNLGLTDFYNQAQKEKKAPVKKSTKQPAKKVSQTTKTKQPVKKTVETKEQGQAKSRVFQRMKEEYKDLDGDVRYAERNLQKEADKAVSLIAKDKKKAYRVAMGLDDAADDLESVSTNIALSEKALKEGNNNLAAELITRRSIEQTRRGQAIVAEKGSISDNSTSKYMREAIDARLRKVSREYLEDIKSGIPNLKEKSVKERADAIIKKKTKQAAEKLEETKRLDLEEAQSIIDNLAC